MVTTTDEIVLQVIQDLDKRSLVGLNKYGVGLDEANLSLKQWLQHSYEECLDQANYLKKAILELEKQETLFNDLNLEIHEFDNKVSGNA